MKQLDDRTSAYPSAARISQQSNNCCLSCSIAIHFSRRLHMHHVFLMITLYSSFN